MTKTTKQYPKTPYPRKEEAHLAVDSEVNEFNYMVNVQLPPMNDSELDVLLASIPAGFAILDTGATTSVVGADTAARYAQHFAAQGFPPPVELEMPPVELRGFLERLKRPLVVFAGQLSLVNCMDRFQHTLCLVQRLSCCPAV